MPAPLDLLPVLLATATVRWFHLVGMAIILGGALLLAFLEHIPDRLARHYEATFWLVLGIVVVTGIGNVGALAPGVPRLDTSWGLVFLGKLIGVSGLIGVSMIRTGLVVRGTETESETETGSRAGSGSTLDRRWYGVTAGWVAVLVVLAVVMVRG